MASELSKRTANERLERVKAQLAGLRERASEESGHLLSTGVKVATGALLGSVDHWAAHREGATSPALLGGLDNAMVLGTLGTALAVMKVGGPMMTARARDVGDAGLTIYGYKWAWQAMADRARGAAAREGAGSPPAAARGVGDRADGVRG